jgi:hypothetical protein
LVFISGPAKLANFARLTVQARKNSDKVAVEVGHCYKVKGQEHQLLVVGIIAYSQRKYAHAFSHTSLHFTNVYYRFSVHGIQVWSDMLDGPSVGQLVSVLPTAFEEAGKVLGPVYMEKIKGVMEGWTGEIKEKWLPWLYVQPHTNITYTINIQHSRTRTHTHIHAHYTQ